MKRFTVLTAAIALSAASAGAAFADADGDRDDAKAKPAHSAQAQGGGHDMMAMMQQMHKGMMGGGAGMMGGGSGMMGGGSGMMGGGAGMMGGGAGMMGGSGAGGGAGMMGQQMMGMMMQNGGMPGAMMTGFDADGDGKLSIEEFESLHSATIRGSMVDRFQALDADGDGVVTETEMKEMTDKVGAGGPMQGGNMGSNTETDQAN